MDVINAMTIDVEDYFQVNAFDRVVARDSWEGRERRVEANTERLLELFQQHHVRATFFVLGWLAERCPSLVVRIAAMGHEVASHGYAHRLVFEQTPAEFRDDVRRAKDVLESAACAPVLGYRAPSYSVTAETMWALDVLVEEGYAYDSSIFPIQHDRYGMPDAPRSPHVMSRSAGALVEVPASTIRLGGVNLPVAGGGYFRILPYWWTRHGISRINQREKRAAVFYLHPWEIDPDQPRLGATGLSWFRHYCNLGKTEPRLKALLQDFRFSTLQHVIGELGLAMPAAASGAA